jgi:hypothetical protein
MRRSVGRDDPHFVDNTEFVQNIDRMAHGLPVRLAAHDDTDQGLSGDHNPKPIPLAAECGRIIGASDGLTRRIDGIL